MDDPFLSFAVKFAEFLKVAGGWGISIILGGVVWRLWKRNEELHAKLERKSKTK